MVVRGVVARDGGDGKPEVRIADCALPTEARWRRLLCLFCALCAGHHRNCGWAHRVQTSVDSNAPAAS